MAVRPEFMPGHRRNFLAPNAIVTGEVNLAAGATIWFGAVVRGDHAPVTVGHGSNVQDGSCLASEPGAPLRLGRSVTVGHQVNLSGCTVGNHSLIGIQAVVERGARIGRWCLIGAGAHVSEGAVIPNGSLAVGNPARVVRRLRWRERMLIWLTAWHYRYNGWRYARKLRPLAL